MSEIKTARLPSHQHLQYLQLVQELPPLSSPQQPETEKKNPVSVKERDSRSSQIHTCTKFKLKSPD